MFPSVISLLWHQVLPSLSRDTKRDALCRFGKRWLWYVSGQQEPRPAEEPEDSRSTYSMIGYYCIKKSAARYQQPCINRRKAVY